MKQPYSFSILFLSILITQLSYGQRMFGIATSNWGGTSGVYINPARIADSRHKFILDIMSLNAFAENDFGTLNNAKLFTQLNSNDILKVNEVFNFNNMPTVNLMMPYAEVRGPGFMWNIDSRNALEVSTRLRAPISFLR